MRDRDGLRGPDDCRERQLANVRGKAVAVSPDEKSIAVGNDSGTVSIYDRSGRRIGEPIKVGGSLLALGWAKERSWLAAGNADGDIVVIDLDATARPPIAKASLPGAPITTLAWRPAGLVLAFACSQWTVCLWPGSDGAPGGAALRRSGGSRGMPMPSLAWPGRQTANALLRPPATPPSASGAWPRTPTRA